MYLAALEYIGEMNVTHRAAHISDAEHWFEGLQELLSELEQEFQHVFAEPEFPITKHCTPFSIPLVDPAVQPTCRKLYQLSLLELAELKRQATDLLESGCIVLISSPYSALILFASKKGGGLHMYVNYY